MVTRAMSILAFWKSHPEWWIAIGKRQAEADTAIASQFWPPPTNLGQQDFLSQIIFHDQFMRHFSRIPSTQVTEDAVQRSRMEAVRLLDAHSSCLADLSETELYFALMPMKHMGMHMRVIHQIHAWLDARANPSMTLYTTLTKFYNDTYKKAYIQDVVQTGLVNPLYPSCLQREYNPSLICDAYPEAYCASSWSPTSPPSELLMPLMEMVEDGEEKPLTISLSGGVDSMVMLAVAVRANIPVQAVHIIYGNRDVATQEASFLAEYCRRLGVPFWVYPVEWLRRSDTEREFYESMTRWLRFAVYRAVAKKGRVLLGHIQDDIVENIWTNFAHGTHLENLAKMETEHVEEGVRICRPWLGVTKDLIYSYAEESGIPYLKNTTPSWSNRGKFRESFHPAVREQYGSGVDAKVIEVAGALKSQADLIDRLLYLPIQESWNAEMRTMDITRAIDADLDGSGWSRILTHLCHSRLGIAKPSIHACADFAARIGRKAFGQAIPLTGFLRVIVRLGTGERVIMQIV